VESLIHVIGGPEVTVDADLTRSPAQAIGAGGKGPAVIGGNSAYRLLRWEQDKELPDDFDYSSSGRA
jgi:hypothetical protein